MHKLHLLRSAERRLSRTSFEKQFERGATSRLNRETKTAIGIKRNNQPPEMTLGLASICFK